jgi:O-antigen ligase
MACWFYGKTFNTRLLLLIGIFDWIAVFFTGSKAGAALAFLLPACCIGYGTVRSRRFNPVLVSIAAILIGFMAVGVALTYQLLTKFQHDSAQTLDTRKLIWRFASVMIHEHLLLGLGFGGWQLKFPLYAVSHAINKSYPPHNSLLIVWSDSGVVAVLAGVAWIVAVYLLVVRALRLGGPEEKLALGIGAAFAWYLLEGFGENLGLTGEIHLTPMIGVLLGHLSARCDLRVLPHARTPEPQRNPSPASALPAV